MGNKDKFVKKRNNKEELLLALRILGKRIKEKDYNKEKLIEFCRQVRKDVYNEENLKYQKNF